MLEPTLTSIVVRAGENPWASTSGNHGWYVLPGERGKKTTIFKTLFSLKSAMTAKYKLISSKRTLKRILKLDLPLLRRTEVRLANAALHSASSNV